MDRVKIYGDTNKVLDDALGGTPNAQLKAWFDFAKGQKNVIATTDNGISGLEVEDTDITIDPVLLALLQGFKVDGAPICIKMTPTQYAQNVPIGISNRLNEDETVRKWSEWHDATHNHTTAADGDKLVYGNSFGYELSSDELLVLLGAGYTIMMAHESTQYFPVVEI